MSEPILGEKITKLVLARRELEQAILLFLEDRDPVSYYLLAHTSHEIIRRVANAKGVKSILKDDSADFINEVGLDKVLAVRYRNKYRIGKKESLEKKICFLMNHDTLYKLLYCGIICTENF